MEASRGIEDIISEITMDGFFVYGYKHGFIDVNEVINALEHGYNIDINEVDLDGKSLLMYACNKHDTEMIEILLNNNVDVNKVDRYGNTALTYACKKGRSSVVERLIGSGAKVREELIISCERGYYDVVEILLNNNVDVNKVNRYGETALMCACGLESSKRIDIVELLLEHNADVNIKSNEEATALIIACKNENLDVVEKLLEHNANISDKAINNKTALMYACDSKNNAIIKTLLSNYIHLAKESTIKGFLKNTGKTLKDLEIARKDLFYLKNSTWFKYIKQKYATSKSQIKEITVCQDEQKLEALLKKNRRFNTKDIYDVRMRVLKALKEDLSKSKEILDNVEHFKTRIEMKRNDIVFDGIKVYKDRVREIK